MGQARDCSDGNACTADSCDSTTGCRHDDVSKACPLSTNPCLAPVCEPLSGCSLVPVTDVTDGTACGPNDCTTARVCVVGTCVNRTAPEGSTCAPRTTCREAGVCHGQQCEVPPAAPMTPRWRYEPPAGHTLKCFGAVDTAGRRVFLNTRLMLQARSLDDGSLLWTQDVSQGVPTYDRRPDGGGSFSLSAPLLVGDTRVGVPLSEGVSDHHAYVRTFDRATGAPGWQLHKKGHLYGVGVDHTGELWRSSANCWAAAGELTRVAPSGLTQATRYHELYPSTAWAGFGIGRAGNTAWMIDRTLSLTNRSTMGVPASPAAVLLRGTELITWDGVNGLMATDVTNGTHRFRTRALEVGASPDFQLVRDGGVAWTGSYTDGGVLGAIDGQGAPLLSCVLPTKAESATAIVRGVAYVFGNGGLSGFSVPELDVESSGWVASNGSPARSGRAR